MKVLIIFRGLNYRIRNEINGQQIINSLVAINNWNQTIFNDLKQNDIDYDIGFITYDSIILNNLKALIKPKYLELGAYNDQTSCLKYTVNFIKSILNNYDRIIILRFDFMYRIKITKWNFWNEKNTFFVNRDANWPQLKLYADMVFGIEKNDFENFYEATNHIKTYGPHEIGKYYYENKIPFNLMFEEYYDMITHPLHSYIAWELEPDLNIPFIAKPRNPIC
jgi:hypothetical protein